MINYSRENLRLCSKFLRAFLSTYAILSLITLTGCGGGGSSDGGEDVIVGTGSYIEGTAAVGAPLVDKLVTIKARQGRRAETMTAASGRFSTPKLEAEGPYLTRVEQTVGKYLYSIAYRNTTGSAEQTLKANIHPFTDLIIRNWFALQNRSIEGLFDNDLEISSLPSQEQISAIEAEIKAIIRQALIANGAPGEFNLFTADFDANNLGFDFFLDNSRVVISNQAINVTIIDAETKLQNIIVGHLPLSSDFTSPIDNAPSTPGNPRALVSEVGSTEGEVILYWDASSDDKGVSGYNIYRNGALAPIATTPFPFYIDTGLALDQTYSYEIEAIDGRSQVSEKASATIKLDAPDSTAPPKATNLSIVETEGKLTLKWTQASISDVAGFRIIRNNNLESYATITATTFIDYDVVNGTSYCYKIKTFDAANNESDPSDEVCELIDGQDDTPNSNTAPDSNAGPDQNIILGTTIILDGSSSSDPDSGDTLSYLWSVISKPVNANTSFNNTNTVSPELTVDTAGTYIIQLETSDGSLSDLDILTIVVTSLPSNAKPVSNAGIDQSVNLGALINLDGSGSSDPDGDTLSYQWTLTSQPSGSSASFDNAQSASPVLSTDTAGAYIAQLEVSDGVLTATDTVNLTINSVPEINSFSASPDNTDSATEVVFAWTVSDTDNDTLTCLLDVDGDGADDYTISNCASTSSQGHSFLVAGNFSARLIINDGKGGSAQQTISVSINNQPTINSLTISPNPAFIDSTATFNWDVSDVDGDTLTCYLDIENDGVDDYTINDCANTNSQGHIYTLEGNYTANLTVSDSVTSAVTDTLALNVTVNLPLSTDISVTGPAVAGERLLYTINVGNTTLSTIENVIVSLVVPNELSFSWSANAEPNPTGCSNCNPTNEAVWNLGTLPAGESRTITVDTLVNVSTLAGVSIVLPVNVSATGISDVVINKSVEVFNTAPADLAMSASVDPVTPSETFTYQFDIGNTSGASLDNTQLRAFLPDGVSVISISNGGTEVNSGEVVWDEGSVGVTSTLHREITVIADSVSAGQILKATAQLTHDGGLAIDNTAENAITVVSSALPLQLDISTSANPVVSTERVLYTLTVSNTSLLPVDDVRVQLRVPAELSFSWSANAEPNPTGCSNCNPTNEALWSLGTLASGESRTITVDTLVASVLSGNLISTPVRVTATDLGDTINMLNTVAIYNTPLADLAISTSVDPIVPNETFTYQLDFGNTSASSLTNSELRAFLPAGVTIDSISDGGTEVTTGEVVWNEGSIDVGASMHREITVSANNVSAGQILKATAQLTHDGGLAVDNTTENATTVVSNALPLQLDISTSANPVVSAERVLYTLTVSNTSLLPVDDVRVQLRVPAELSFSWSANAEPNPTGCSNCNPTNEALWSLGTLASGESRTITVDTLVASVLSGNLISTPVRVTATDLGDTINMLNTVAIYNTPSTDLAVNSSVDPVVPNETFTYQLDFSNTSDSTLSSVTLRAYLPEGVSVSTISDGGTEVSTREVVWNVASLNSGSALHREVVVIADAVTAGDTLKLLTELSHNGGLEVDQRSEFAVSVAKNSGSAPQLTIDIATTPNPVVSEGVLAYTITVTNNYGLPLNDVSVLLRIPDELSFSWSTDAEPSPTGCNCNPTQEAVWALGSLASGASQVITINANVGSGLANGIMIVAPFRVSATGMEDTINLQQVTVIQN